MPTALSVAAAALDATRPGLPLVDRAACLASRYAGTTCSRCVEACPTGAIDRASRPLVDPGRCDGCGACGAACPSGALVSGPLESLIGTWHEALASSRGTAATVACDRAGILAVSPVDLALPCLGALRSADLVAAAVSGAATIEVKIGDCEACPRGVAGRGVRDAVTVARRALASVGGPDGRICLTVEAGRPSREPRDRSVSRRELFTIARRQVRAVATVVARDTESTHARLARRPRVPAWHRRLVASLATMTHRVETGEVLPVSLGVGAVTIADGCDRCGLCALACPHGLLVPGSPADRPTVAHPCTACGLCAEVCPIGMLQVVGVRAAAVRVQMAAPTAGVTDLRSMLPAPGGTEAADAAPVRDALLSAARLLARSLTADRAMREAALGTVTRSPTGTGTGTAR